MSIAALANSGRPAPRRYTRSLREAGRSRDAEFAELGRKTTRAYRVWTASNYAPRPARRVIRLLRRARGKIDVVVAAVALEQSSSPDGETYKRLLLVALDEFDRPLVWEMQAVRAGTRGNRLRMRRCFDRATVLHRRARRHERQAVEAIGRVLPG